MSVGAAIEVGARQRPEWCPPAGMAGPLLLLAPALVFLAVFFVGPLILNLQESLKSPAGAPSATQYIKIFTDPYYLAVLGQTVLFGAAVTAICLVFGYPLAYALARAEGGWKAAMLFVIVAPLLTNVVVRSYGWMIVLGGSGLINNTLRQIGFEPVELMYSWTAVTIAMAHVLLPFMVLSIGSVLETHDRRLDEAAATLGANPRQVFARVIFPLSIEGVITGCILVFTVAIGSFVTLLLLGKTSTMTFAVLIYQQLSVVSNWAFAAAMGMMLLTIVIAAFWLQGRLRPVRR
jgi:putative spermidine/putrescine transport system permease protein